MHWVSVVKLVFWHKVVCAVFCCFLTLHHFLPRYHDLKYNIVTWQRPETFSIHCNEPVHSGHVTTPVQSSASYRTRSSRLATTWLFSWNLAETQENEKNIVSSNLSAVRHLGFDQKLILTRQRPPGTHTAPIYQISTKMVQYKSDRVFPVYIKAPPTSQQYCSQR